MRVLIDTHAFIWWNTEDERLSDRARRVMEDEASEIFVSVGSIWEVATKVAKGRLEIPGDLETYVDERLAANRWVPLSIDRRHVIRAAALPVIHRDPLDRILIAQAQLDDMPIVTTDPAITRYDVETIW